VPKISGTFGDNWQTSFGKLGLVVTGSYAKQEVASAKPRFDRNRVNVAGSGNGSQEAFSFLRTQYLVQALTGEDYETKNLTASLELQANDELKFYVDATINDQERVRTGANVQVSGTGTNPVIGATNNTGFETVDLGTVDGEFGQLVLGEVQVVTSGVLDVASGPAGGKERQDPNLRTNNFSGNRLTKSKVFAFGSEWTGDKLQINAELSYSDSKSDEPQLTTVLDFVNPKGLQPSPTTFFDNGTPAIFNIENGTFEFGIAQGLASTPSTADLLSPSNYRLNKVGRSLRVKDASDTAARIDFTYDVSEINPFFMEINAGVRFNETTNTSNNSVGNNSFTKRWERPTADLFSDIITAGPNNFNGADSRTLFIPDYLIVGSDVSYNNPDLVIDALNEGIVKHNDRIVDQANKFNLITAPTQKIEQFFDITEETMALYVQGDFETELGSTLVTGNLGVRYLTTDIESIGSSVVDGVATPSSSSGSYDFVLPRLNLAAELVDDVILRASMGKDIRRPNFGDLSTSANFGDKPSNDVRIGNPELEPEEIWSYDLSLDYYFSQAGFVSAGLFHKERKNLIATSADVPAEPIGPTGQIERDVTAPCEEGGIWNPNVPNENYAVFSSSTTTNGICNTMISKFNVDGDVTQSGIELAGQFDLSGYEDELGWASGFGVIANYTYQESGGSVTNFDPASDINALLGRTDKDGSTATLDDDVVTKRKQLPGLSENAYNFTVFYDKNDLNVRMRYTYRDSFVESGLGIFKTQRIIGARGQLNMSVNYAINDTYSVGIQGVNLTREDRTLWCINEGTLLCQQSLTDRRITIGITGKL
jgi:TonB-dependent receptor